MECVARVRAEVRIRGGGVAAEGHSGIDALSQFKLESVLGHLGESLHISQANVMMVAASALTLGLMWIGMSPRAMIPGRLQSAAEMAYETVLNLCIEQIGPEGKKFFPFLFTLFFFILFGNLMGVFPLFFTFTSHIAVTLGLSLFVFCLVTYVALKEHGMHFFSYFVPKGIPAVLTPLMVLIEVISYLSRIISLSVRLFANMMAGHVMLEVFGAFVVMLGTAGGLLYVPAALSLSVNVILIGFELLEAMRPAAMLRRDR